MAARLDDLPAESDPQRYPEIVEARLDFSEAGSNLGKTGFGNGHDRMRSISAWRSPRTRTLSAPSRMA